MSANEDRRLGWSSVGVEDGGVNIWFLPLWLKGDRLVKAQVTPRTARRIAIQLLEAAEKAEAS